MLTDIGSIASGNNNGIGNGNSGHIGSGHGLVSGLHSSDSSSGIGSASSEKLAARGDEASAKKGSNGEGDADEDDDEDDEDDDEDQTTVYTPTWSRDSSGELAAYACVILCSEIIINPRRNQKAKSKLCV